MHQESTGQNSVTLLWQEPDQPNGIILEYEIKYYEKVTLSLFLRGAPAGSQPCTRGFFKDFVVAVLMQGRFCCWFSPG